MKYKLSYSLFYILNLISKILPNFAKDKLAKSTSILWYKLHSNYRKRVLTNLNFIYPNKSENEKKELAKGVFLNLTYNLGSFIDNFNTKKEKILQKVTFKNEDILLNALQQNRPIIFVTGHYSNWEILPLAIAAKYTPLIGVGRPLDQDYLDKVLRKNREQFGNKMINKHGAMRELVKAMKQKKVVGLLVDQNLDGIEVEFMGKKTIHTTSVAILAQKFNAIAIPCFIKRVGFEQYIATFYKPIEADKEEFIFNHTQKQAIITQKVIEEDISQWMWIHRRWKATYPDIYK